MSTRRANPSTFVIERDYAYAPARVFSAWANKDAKFRWFASAPGWETQEYSFDFREGGHEIWRGGPIGGEVHFNNTLYWDIVPDERIIFSYEMQVDASVSPSRSPQPSSNPPKKAQSLSIRSRLFFWMALIICPSANRAHGICSNALPRNCRRIEPKIMSASPRSHPRPGLQDWSGRSGRFPECRWVR